MNSNSTFDFIVIGAGIAGASVAAELASEAKVLVLEMESQAGYHTTGRSAAVFAPNYGPAPIRALTRASESFFRQPPGFFSDQPLFSPRPIMFVARSEQMQTLHNTYSELSRTSELSLLDSKQTFATQPLLRQEYAEGSVLDNNGQDIDVHSLHQGYLRRLKERGGNILKNMEVTAMSREKGIWSLRSKQRCFKAPVVVNAAGAWADQIALLAGAESIALVPKRRSALIVAAPLHQKINSLPITIDIEEEFYLKPDAGRLLISPANEDPEDPCDVQPSEMDIALCVDRIERAFDLSVKRIESRWAGLRSFVKDKCPVVGFSARVPSFYWLAGQGGYGIQTAPALSRLAAAQLCGSQYPADILSEGLDVSALSPERI